MRVISLGSGSSGNATLVVAGADKVLIDAGLPTRALERGLCELDTDPRELAAIFLTHEHGDHVAAAGVLARRYGITLVANEHTLSAADLGKARTQVLPTGGSIHVGKLRVASFELPHDCCEPVGYRVEEDGIRMCHATDLGHIPLSLRDEIRAAHLVVLEANHDRDRLLNGPYPSALKSRISGHQGHLSNQQAADAIVASASGRPQWVWLAHLSDVNNSPRRALQAVRKALRDASIDSVDVSVALRDRRSVMWDSAQCFVQSRLAL